jgi:hypothetical protein
MKAFLFVTYLVFGLITLAHVARLFTEGHAYLAADPVFLVLTLLAPGLCGWSAYLLKFGSHS